MESKVGLDIEEALVAAGGWGRYQKLILLLSFAAAIPNAFISLHFVFSQYEPQHHCSYPPEYQNFINQSNAESPETIAMMIPLEKNKDNELVKTQCKIYDRNYSQYPVETWPEKFTNKNNSKIVDCTHGVTYAFTKTEETAVMEFGMVCEDDWRAPLGVSFYHFGMAIGAFFGITADWYGRRPVFVAASAVQILSQVFCAVSWNFPAYCAAIGLSGLCGLMNYVVSFVLMTEVVDPKWRNFMTISSTYSFVAGYCIIALVAYFFRQWRVFIGVMAAIGAVLYIPCCWFFPESPRWLAQKGKRDEAVRYLRLIARVNGRRKYFDEALQSKGSCIISKNNLTSTGAMETIRVLFRSGIASRYFAAVFGWTVSSMLYYAISIYSSDFSSNRFINLFLGGVAEFPAYVIGFLLLKYLGRPRTALLLMWLCGISSIILPFIPKALPSASTALALIGKGSISAAYYGWYLISSEVVPTLQRSAAMSICSAIARIGSFSAPYLMYTRKYSYLAPNMTMGTVAILCGLVAILFVPETQGMDVPDTPEEARKNKRFYRFNVFKTFPAQKSSNRLQPQGATDEENVAMI